MAINYSGLFIIGAVILIAQQIADAAITLKTISSGVGTEANPISGWFIAKFGNLGLFVEKLLIVPFIAAMWLLGPPWWHLIWLLILSYCVVLISNYRVLMGGKGLLG